MLYSAIRKAFFKVKKCRMKKHVPKKKENKIDESANKELPQIDELVIEESERGLDISVSAEEAKKNC